MRQRASEPGKWFEDFPTGKGRAVKALSSLHFREMTDRGCSVGAARGERVPEGATGTGQGASAMIQARDDVAYTRAEAGWVGDIFKRQGHTCNPSTLGG